MSPRIAKSPAAKTARSPRRKSPGRGKYDRSLSGPERRAVSHDHLLDAATEVFATRGYVAARVEDIIARAGISRRTFYEHFDSSEAILTEVFDRAVRVILATVTRQVAAAADPLARIRAGIGAYCETIAAHPAAARVIFEEYARAGAAQAARYELNTTRFTLLLFESLSAAHAAGGLRRAPDETSVYALTKGIEAVAVRAIHRGEAHHLPALAPQLADLLLEAFGRS